VKNETQYLEPAEAAKKQEQARLARDEDVEMMWNVRPLVASGFVIADGEGKKLNNGIFDFRPETIEETFMRVCR